MRRSKHLPASQSTVFRAFRFSQLGVEGPGKNNCPLRFYLGLNLSMGLRESNFDYFATKCYGQLSIQWIIVHTMSISWTIVHEMDNCYTIVHIVGNVHS